MNKFYPIVIEEISQDMWSAKQQNRFEYNIKKDTAYGVVSDFSFKRVVQSPMHEIVFDLIKECIFQEDISRTAIKSITIGCIDFFEMNDLRNEYMLTILLRDDNEIIFPFNFWSFYQAGMMHVTAQVQQNNQRRFRGEQLRFLKKKEC